MESEPVIPDNNTPDRKDNPMTEEEKKTLAESIENSRAVRDELARKAAKEAEEIADKKSAEYEKLLNKYLPPQESQSPKSDS